ncbi:MAG TPA: EAL domain-containing response regulator [Stellaceae bacterium]|nr:EAL domain-containing response regulator [Stellaceae bacterium]
MNRDRLLVIDDDAGFRSYVRRVSETVGYETLVTEDADDFKEKVRSWRPSVIILDLQMPKVDGVELLRALGETKSAAKILIASGFDEKVVETAAHLAAERGLAIAGALKKPVRAAMLRDRLERLREVETPLLASALAHAIRTGELLLEYQPKLDCKSGEIFGVEALVRWQHPTRGLIPPDRFIALAEQNGLIHDLTRWVAATAIRQTADWRRSGLPIHLALNISAVNLENIELPEMIVAHCAEAGLAPDAVTLELTESAAMGNMAQGMDVLTRLRLKGMHLSIDDFGTGYSSLIQLQRLPFSEIKIDKSFVMKMGETRECRVLVEAVIGIAQRLGLFAVAEGVETAEALTALTELGCDAAQGYFISRPVRPEAIAAAVRNRVVVHSV